MIIFISFHKYLLSFTLIDLFEILLQFAAFIFQLLNHIIQLLNAIFVSNDLFVNVG